jgi:hypothetical protein
MRKFTHLLLAAGLVLGLTSTAQAGTFVPADSNIRVIFGGLPAISFPATPGTEALVGLGDQLVSPFGHFVGAQASVWSTVNFGPGTSLFTGVPLISNLKVTAANNVGNVQNGFVTASNPMSNGAKGQIGPTLGGHIRLSGQTIISALGAKVPVNVAHVGGLMGETTTATLASGLVKIIATNGPFVTESLVITKVTSNLISVPGRAGQKTGVGFTMQPATDEFVRTFNTSGGFQSLNSGLAAENHTVTISGTNNLASGSKAGMVTVVAPLRIDTGLVAGVIPGLVDMKFTFVPEPGTMLLLVSGAVGLAVIGRRRMRK